MGGCGELDPNPGEAVVCGEANGSGTALFGVVGPRGAVIHVAARAWESRNNDAVHDPDEPTIATAEGDVFCP